MKGIVAATCPRVMSLRPVAWCVLCPGLKPFIRETMMSLLLLKHLRCFLLYSKKESEQRQKELLEGISPALLELVEKNREKLLFDKGGCQLVLAALLKCTGARVVSFN